MIDALRYVKHLIRGGSEALQGHAKEVEARLVATSLLGGNHIGEVHLQLASSRGEQIVIDIGQDGEFKFLFELA